MIKHLFIIIVAIIKSDGIKKPEFSSGFFYAISHRQIVSSGKFVVKQKQAGHLMKTGDEVLMNKKRRIKVRLCQIR